MTWQPIETAPKDGTYILVFPGLWTDVTCSIARYDYDTHARNPKPFWKRVDDMGLVSRSRSCQPTHWMPLPEPPEVQS